MLGLIMAGVTFVAAVGSKLRMDYNDHQMKKEANNSENQLGIYLDSHGNTRSIYNNQQVSMSRENGDRVIRDNKGRLIQNVDASLRYQEAYELWKKGVEENPNVFVVKCEKRFSKMEKNWAVGQVYREVQDFHKSYVKRYFMFEPERWEEADDYGKYFCTCGAANYTYPFYSIKRKTECKGYALLCFYMNTETGLLERVTEECERDLCYGSLDREKGYQGTKEIANEFMNHFNIKQKEGGYSSLDYYYNDSEYCE